MRNILSYLYRDKEDLSKEKKEWDKKLEELWYKEYMVYCRYSVTSDKELHQRARDAWDHLMRYPNMFHDKGKGRQLLDRFWEKVNPYPIYIPVENKSNVFEVKKESYVGVRIVNLEEYKRRKRHRSA